MARPEPREPTPAQEIFLGSVEAEPRDADGRTWAHGYRLGLHSAAEALGYHVIQREEPWSRGRVTFYGVRETPRERRVIAEGLARFEAAARVTPALLNRWRSAESTA